MERHIVENDIRHRSRYTVHIPKADGKGTAVVKLRDILDPIIADVLIGAAAEGDAADHAVFNILIVFKTVLVIIEILHLFPDLKLDGARAECGGIIVFHQTSTPLVKGPATFRHCRAEEEKRKFDFVVSRAVMPLGDLIKIIRKNIRQEQHNALPNGLICLKGGELEQETMPVKHKTMLYDLKNEFTEDFFKTKKVVYVTISGL